MSENEDFQARLARVRERLEENPRRREPPPRPPGVPAGHELLDVPQFRKAKTSAGSAVRWGAGMGMATLAAGRWAASLGFPPDVIIPLRAKWAAEILLRPFWTQETERALPAIAAVFALGVLAYVMPFVLLIRRRWDPHHTLVYLLLFGAVALATGLFRNFA